MFENCPVCKTKLNASDQVCPTCGFKLVGNTQEFRPVQISSESEKSSENKPISEPNKNNSTSYYLLVLTGLQKGSKFTLDENDVTFGRDVNCGIFLNDMTVSRRHALIYFEKGAHIIKDLGSFNGVWVNNKNVTSKALRPGDIIQLGNFNFEYCA